MKIITCVFVYCITSFGSLFSSYGTSSATTPMLPETTPMSFGPTRRLYGAAPKPLHSEYDYRARPYKTSTSTTEKTEATRVLMKHSSPTTDIVTESSEEPYTEEIEYITVDDEDFTLPSYEEEELPTEYLVELFRAQKPVAPELPPVVAGPAPKITFPHVPPSREYLPPTQSPTPPIFDQSYMVKGFLTVRQSDYTESYIAWYNSSSGEARVDFHGGETSVHRVVLPTKEVQLFERTTDRTYEDGEIRLCGATRAAVLSASLVTPPAVPDLSNFYFSEHRTEFDGPVQVWRREVEGGDEEYGAVRGERLTFHHEVVVMPFGSFSVPIKYTVSVDSSVLGTNFDGYEHVYAEMHLNQEDVFNFDPDKSCDMVEPLDLRISEDLSRLDPLREFFLPYRDPGYDAIFENFTNEYQRLYVDPKENAVRKTILINNLRFIRSVNRMGLTFKATLNFFADRLEAEMEEMFGVKHRGEMDQDATAISYSKQDFNSTAGRLPKNFDWRNRNLETTVHYQGSCAASTIFAVVDAVEAFYFKQTFGFLNFSRQCVLDCIPKVNSKYQGQQFPTPCEPSWPSTVYRYIQERGIPFSDHYPDYKQRVFKCDDKEVAPITHIGSYSVVKSHNTLRIDALKIIIHDIVPAVLLVDGKCLSFRFYGKGFLQDYRCIKGPMEDLTHAVLAIGWRSRRNQTFFTIKNSWGGFWGIRGFAHLHAESNTMGILTYPTYPVLKKTDIDHQPEEVVPTPAYNSYVKKRMNRTSELFLKH